MPATGPRRPKAVNGEYLMMDEEQARRCIAYVTRGRQRLAERVRSVVLFGESRNELRKNDHPMVQILYKMRDLYESLNDEESQIALLDKMFKASKELTMEGNKASVEIAQMLHAKLDLSQRQKEHRDKMELARLAKGGGYTDAELAAAVGDNAAIPWKPASALDGLELPPELEALTVEGQKRSAIGPVEVGE